MLGGDERRLRRGPATSQGGARSQRRRWPFFIGLRRRAGLLGASDLHQNPRVVERRLAECVVAAGGAAVAGAAELVMGKLSRIPVAIVRGLRLEPGDEGSKPLLRDPARDLFR